jgi:uncharacterized protein YqhQ
MPDHHERDHFYGGQAVIEGVMMRGLDRYAVAVRRQDGQIVIGRRRIPPLTGWRRWPLVRGCVGLVETFTLGMGSLQFSADVAMAEENERIAAAKAAETPEVAPATAADDPPAEPAKPSAIQGILTSLTGVFAVGLGLVLFILLPTWLAGLILHAPPAAPTWGWPSWDVVSRNMVEGAARLSVLVLYIVGISLIPYVKRVFQYHGAEHATINCYEAGEDIVVENCKLFGPLHPRCGTAFLLIVIVVKIIINCFLPWYPQVWLRSLVRLGTLLPVAAIAYEVIRWAGRHRKSLFSRLLAGPGLLLQMLTTRKADEKQLETAIYALAAVADEVALPSGFPAPMQEVQIAAK